MAKKDACYHKVKARYKVFPSAYASGALAKCRKVGAKNWVINLNNMAKVKPHKMYCKDGTVHNVSTYKEHKALMKKGCNHKKPKNGSKKN